MKNIVPDNRYEAGAERPKIAPVPRIAVHAFCESPDIAEAIEWAAQDRLMARARVTVNAGGLAAAVQVFQGEPTPPLIIVEGREEADTLLPQLDRLAEACDEGTKVVVIGHTNDITLYRELTKRGVSEYLVAPLDPLAVIAAISGIYADEDAGKLGQVYAFISAKGGAGSSTIAHNVGWTIGHRFDSAVILADMDLPFGTGSLNFNLEPAQGIAEAIQDVGRLDEVLLDRLLTKYDDHLSLLAAPASLGRAYDLDPGAFEPLIEVAQASVPFIVLDVPHLWTSWTQRTLALADQVVITATPDLASLRNAKNLIGFLRQTRPNDPPPKLVLNQVGVPKRPEIKPRDFADALDLSPVAAIPFDPHLFETAANNGQMIAQSSAKSNTAGAFAEIAQIITGRKESKRRKRLLDFGRLVRTQKR